MRTFELRAYTLRTREALNDYVNEVYPSHLESFPLFGIAADGFVDRQGGGRAPVFRAGLLCAGTEPGEVVRRYMQSAEFAEDIRDFDVSDILDVNRRFSSLPQARRSSNV